MEDCCCSTYIKILVDDEDVFQTGEDNHDENTIYVSKRISKTTPIKIEIFNDDSGFEDSLIQRIEGDAESFLNEPIQKGAEVGWRQNFIVTSSIWEDEYFELWN